MNIVFAKHEKQNREFLFEVPEGMDIRKGDILYAETMKGPCVAVATSDMMPGNEELITRLGAYMPLKKVITYANKEIQNYICDCVTCEMVTQIMNSCRKRDEITF